MCPEVIISASGVQHGLIVNPDGTLGVSGTFSIGEVEPTGGLNPATELIYIISGTSTGVTGSEIGSIILHKADGTGSYVRVLTYSNNQLVNVGSWT